MPPITADEEYSKNSKLKKENIQQLRNWLTKQPHLPTGITDEQLILFLHCCQYSLEASKHTIESYYSIRTHAPDEIVVLPKRDQHGNVLLAGRIVDTDVSKFVYDDCLKAWFMLQDINLLEEGAVPGFIFLFDLKDCKIGHVTSMKISSIKKYFMYIQEAFPGVVIANHMINMNPVAETFVNMCKPFMKKELLIKLHLHSTMDTLLEHITKDALPKEFGGNLDSLTEYHKVTLEQLEKFRGWFKKEEEFRVDESKRPGKAKNAGDVFGVEGSFKKLDID
ncbi:hypothetical protein C0J52_26947 [Blattella germanica]|nr:hypothetical protein C0J52_26947 [Blattella germanica]